MDVRRLIEATISGAAAGLAASWIMSQVDGAWKTASSEDQDGDEPNTVKAADAVTEATVGETVPDEYRDATGTAVHYGFGALLGALYGAGVALQPATSAGFGSIYGSAVSLVADEMAMPALGFTPPASEVAASTHLRGFVSHFVFGVSLEAVRRLLVLSFRQQDS